MLLRAEAWLLEANKETEFALARRERCVHRANLNLYRASGFSLVRRLAERLSSRSRAGSGA